VKSSCERGNELSGSIKCWETTEWLHNWWPLEWYSAPHSFIYILRRVRLNVGIMGRSSLRNWAKAFLG
jgi:hypothetical protein